MEAGLGNKSWNEQRFQVEGRISFSTGSTALPNPEILSTRIRGVDQKHPWLCHYVGGKHAPSIRWMSAAIVREEGEFWDRSYTFQLRPPFDLKADQFYAYHRYLATLAELLASEAIDGVGHVHCWLKIAGGGASFMTPAAMESLERTMQQPGFQELRALCRRALRPPDERS